jgi:hypothetical protein
MAKLAIVIAGCLFVAGAIVTFFSNWNWQGALFLLAIGAGALIFVFRSQ